MEKTILRAKQVLSDMLNVNTKHFEHSISRERNVVAARRFLTYFMVTELGIQYNKVKDYIPALGNHATAIHHTKRLEELMEVEPESLREYETFKETLLGDDCTMIEKEVIELTNQKLEINRQIRKLKQIIV